MRQLPANRCFIAFTALVLMLVGCAGYRLGPTNGAAAGARSVQIGLFTNETMEPRLTEAVATSIRRRIQQDSTYRLVTKPGADVILSGRLTDYRRISLSFQPLDILTPRDLELRMTAYITAVETRGGKTLINQEVTSRATIRPQRDLAGAERQAVSLLADDLARNVTSMLVDGGW